MPITIRGPDGVKIVEAEPLSQSAFAQFGTVIENPSPALIHSSVVKNDLPPNAVTANQGSALKYVDVTIMKNLYSEAPSEIPAKAVMNMFVCAPRSLGPSPRASAEGYFAVEILERHPFTTQTFIPLGLSKSQSRETQYLAIVAPTLPSPSPEGFPVPSRTQDGSGQKANAGLPDLSAMKAFLANGSQAVTYGAGTWHAPMVVVGKRAVDFVVVQFANGVGLEDCQEAELKKEQKSGLLVAIPNPNFGLWKL